MAAALTLIVLGISSVLLLAAAVFVRWLMADIAEHDTMAKGAPRRASIFRRLFRWANAPVPKLSYRRDKRGRFRKVWRG